jgi:hypothetical protein
VLIDFLALPLASLPLITGSRAGPVHPALRPNEGDKDFSGVAARLQLASTRDDMVIARARLRRGNTFATRGMPGQRR